MKLLLTSSLVSQCAAALWYLLLPENKTKHRKPNFQNPAQVESIHKETDRQTDRQTDRDFHKNFKVLLLSQLSVELLGVSSQRINE